MLNEDQSIGTYFSGYFNVIVHKGANGKLKRYLSLLICEGWFHKWGNPLIEAAVKLTGIFRSASTANSALLARDVKLLVSP